MNCNDFIRQYGLAPDTIDGPKCLSLLLEQMELGLAGQGNIPMIPSYLTLDSQPQVGKPCCVLDAGGTNLRVAKAEFQADGSCTISDLRRFPMPGTQGVLSAKEFYETLADHVRNTGCTQQIGLCFSYNVLQERTLDGILMGWCKEVRVPDAPGKPVGASLRNAIGAECDSVRVLNDSTAALLGAHSLNPEITLGLILGTGINICYCEPCARIQKVPRDLNAERMIISTEIGEFDGFPKSPFDAAVIASSDEPELAHSEKQCAGAYLGQIISLAWQEAAHLGLLSEGFQTSRDLPTISNYLAGDYRDLPQDAAAMEIAQTVIHRAAKIAAVLTAGPILRSCPAGASCTLVIEGSQYHRLTGFGPAFRQELEELLAPHNIVFSLAQVENSCLLGAAMAAFAQPM